MRIIPAYIACVFSVVVWSCDDGDTCEKNDIKSLLVSIQPLEVPILDAEGYYHSVSDVVIFQDSIYYLGFDGGKSTIDIYNLSSKSFRQKIYLPTQGPNAINHYGGQVAMKALSLDTIVFISPYKDFYLVDGEGEILCHQRLNFDKFGADRPYQSLDFLSLGVSELANCPVTPDSKGNVYVALLWSEDYYEVSNLTVEYSLPPFLGIPVKEPDSMFFVGKYPEVSNQSSLPRSIVNSIAFSRDGQPVIQFEAFHQLYSPKRGFICANYSKQNIDFRSYSTSKIINEKEEMQFFISDPAYVALVSDTSAGRYYRFVKHYQEYNDSSENPKLRLEADFSIQVFNEELEYLGEHRFAGGKYDYLKPHVMPGGRILFSKETSANNSNKEEQLEFDIIAFDL